MTSNEKSIIQKAQKLNTWICRNLYYCFGKTPYRQKPVKRGEVYFVDLGENVGSEENKQRPVVVIQSNSYNYKSPVFICAIISSSQITIPDIQIPIVNTYSYTDNKGKPAVLCGAIDLGQIKTVAKERICSEKICLLGSEMDEVDEKLFNALGLHKAISSRDNIINSLQGKIDYLQNKQSDT